MDLASPLVENGRALSPARSTNVVFKPMKPELILDYLERLLITTLGATREDLESEGSLLSRTNRAETLTRCARFANEGQEVLFVQKDAVQVPDSERSTNGVNGHGNGSTNGQGNGVPTTEEEEELEQHFSYKLAQDPSFSTRTAASIAILKRPLPLDASYPITSQVSIINLPGIGLLDKVATVTDSTPYETLHSIVHNAISPYFNAYTQRQTDKAESATRYDPEGKTGVTSTKKKLAELELSLLHLHQNVEIPQLYLPIHQVVQEALRTAREKAVRPSPGLISTSFLTDSRFLNDLQSSVNAWVKSIQTITKMSRDPDTGSARQEINFWLSMETRLGEIRQQLQGDGIQLTIDTLRQAKRYIAITSFESDIGLDEAVERTQRYNQMMRDFPIDEMLSAPTPERLETALENVFQHVHKKSRVTQYPVSRTVSLLCVISGDVEAQVQTLLRGRRIMLLDYADFQDITTTVRRIWQTWEENTRELTNTFRELIRRRGEKFVPIKFNARYTKTKDRLDYVEKFRTNHEQLARTITSVLGVASQDDDASGKTSIGDIDAVAEVSQAYAALKDVDVLDVSEEGTQLWLQAETLYNERTARVENTIILKLRDRLATAKTANEMFRVFSKFNALLVRQKVQSAIKEYQTQLIDRVKRDIAGLQERFKQQYGHSEARIMAQLHDVPPVSGAIIWARQIEKQLQILLAKVEAVLGKDWEGHREGQGLADDSANFLKKLDTKPVYDSWLADVDRRRISVSGFLFGVTRNRALNNNLELFVAFDPQTVSLFREVRNLLWLNFPVPNRIGNIAREAKKVYPFSVSLGESVGVLKQTNQTIQGLADASILLATYEQSVQKLVETGMHLRWEVYARTYDMHALTGGELATQNTAHLQFIRDFGVAVETLSNKTSLLVSVRDKLNKHLQELQTCSYQHEVLRANLEGIQALVDRLNLENFSNLEYWVASINQKLESLFMTRLHDAINLWIEQFQTFNIAAGVSSKQHRRQAMPDFAEIAAEISMQHSVIYLEPPSQEARAYWLQSLQSWIGRLCSLPKLQATRFELNVDDQIGVAPLSFSDLPSLCVDQVTVAYTAIDARCNQVNEYMLKWLQFQSLWDLNLDDVVKDLGDDLAKWLQIIQEIRKERTTFDTTEPREIFTNLVINYENAQAKITAKYDQWQHDIVQRFGIQLGNRMTEMYADLGRSRRDLEGQSLEASSTAQAVSLITAVQDCKRKVELWEPEMEVFSQGQTLLNRHRQLPQDWLHIEQINHEWAIMQDVLARKLKVVEEQSEALRAQLLVEDQAIGERIKQAISDWEEQKPNSGATPPEKASATLSEFQRRFAQLKSESDMVLKAKEVLDLPGNADVSIEPVLEELQDLSAVWGAVSSIWKRLDELREGLWSAVVARKVRQSLEALRAGAGELPVRMRQYPAYEYVDATLKKHITDNTIINDLKSDAMKSRHWQKIYKTLRPNQRYSESSMTLGDVWDLQPSASESAIREVIIQAQGEMALDNFLKEVRGFWENYQLERVNYQQKCQLIRGWDELFEKCSEHLNGLQAMAHSPYYKSFKEEASTLEDKLNRVHVMFDVWIDVQRQWVYLEGVFTGNADIKHLLPVESSRFQNINNEFQALLRKVTQQITVFEIIEIPGALKSLERLADLLNKIQKALGEYLERERMSFPRFYFVGDEDLLEMIGNSNDTLRIAKHFKKMFAGISGLILEEEGTTIAGFTSKEGEEVLLSKSISLTATPKINDWLRLLETSMKATLALRLRAAVQDFSSLFEDESLTDTALIEYINSFPAQIAVLAIQIVWTRETEQQLESQPPDLDRLYKTEVRLLELLASIVLQELDPVMRKKCEHIITECVHQRDTISSLQEHKASSTSHYLWEIQMKYIYTESDDPEKCLRIAMANSKLPYGFEYLGVPERLVRTPLTDRCFLTLTQGLAQRLGGSPYGPAGTGKTESVKALGLQLGRFTLVFCCDDTFDFQAMGRIFLGICQVGAWGCFDEFNRLEERILSAVSQQVQDIQVGLKATAHNPNAQVELAGRRFKVNSNTGLFITMNPGYAGRSNLPDNLKKLFRSVAMSKPDKELIAEVMLYSQGFRHAKILSKQTVPFFDECDKLLSKQPHYDFGLRALKSVLISSGASKRKQPTTAQDQAMDDSDEAQIILQSLHETISPKLIHGDTLLLSEIEKKSFPGIAYVPAELDDLRAAVQQKAKEQDLVVSDVWMTKIMQLYQIQNIHHGLMMVGNAGTGKSVIWKTLLQAMQQVGEKKEGVSYIIDSKVMSKESLYGSLDSTTREWTDGLFTSILRRIVDNVRGEENKLHWIVFDGDVDPEWVENLNSVLDDNKLLTLPNGERLSLPPNVRIMFEVETLKYATLATVSRCGMVWFNDATVTPEMIASHYLDKLASTAFEELDDEAIPSEQATRIALNVQQECSVILRKLFSTNDFLLASLRQAATVQHIMDFTDARALSTLFSLLNKACRDVIKYNLGHQDFPVEADQMDLFVERKLLLSTIWAFTGDCTLALRQEFGLFVSTLLGTMLPALEETGSVIDFDVQLPQAQWIPWQVPSKDLHTHEVTQTDVVIPTLDTVRHEEIMYSWLAEHKPLILCGPPGSGKTMTLFSSLRKLENMEVAALNFSSATTPELILKTFDQYCEYRKTVNGVVMAPSQIGRWLVLFCDEINLPAPDKYGTQRAISFLRQLVEQQGFWRTSDRAWVSIERIQFVGACNPPTDAGRTSLSSRFLRHAPVVMVDYPGEISLHQIYSAFSTALLKVIPDLRGFAQPMTKAMVQFYLESQARFTPQIQPHYVYSPRELTRWVRGIYKAIQPLDTLSSEGLVRIWAHEALRLFQDRLVAQDERDWTVESVHRIAVEHFPSTDNASALQSPILFSNWLTKDYVSVDQSELRSFVEARMKTFCEEEVDVPLVLFNDVLEHVLRIDRVFRQPQGHLILIGVSGSGKTTLSRFVAWMNGLKVFQIKVHGRYSAQDFDDDLRNVLKRAGCKGEKICFIMDESNVLDSGFLERMNTLLANAEVPGLFEGDEYTALMTACREGAQRQGSLLDSQEELYKWFTQQIVKNLHVVFTMNPPEDGLSSKAATSPALFNRCVLDWFGDWSDQALYQVATELTQKLDLDRQDFVARDSIPVAYQHLALPANHRTAMVNAMVHVHHSLHLFNHRLFTRQAKTTFLTPRHYLDFVGHYVRLYDEKRAELEDQQRHVEIGLEKLRDTVEKVSDLRASLAIKKTQLNTKQKEANEKLERMVVDKANAEITKATAEAIRRDLDVQDREVARRKEEVRADLAKAEPAIVEAKESVSNIKKQHLTEVRSMANPPAGVKLALEAVCTLLGHRIDSWKAIQAIIRRDDFIASIVNFENTDRMSRPLRNRMQTEFLANEDFTYERVNRASKACGPLVQWTEAQVNYSAILDRVGPLRQEAESLEQQATVTRQKAQNTENEIKQLEQSIVRYSTEYAALITETEAIKTEMKKVESKVNRSVNLLENLASERIRWESGSKSFATQIGTIAGDVLVAAAFLAYAGLFDQQYRMQMIADWQNQLTLSGILFKEHNTIESYLASPSETLQWQADGLPIDDLCTENAVIMKKYNRYPLVIDPTGRALQWLQNAHKERKVTVTSFLDDSFVKQLESSIRFGNPIIVQDAEHLDPILNHVLNKEYQKTGGRTLIQLGKQEIDFSKDFKLYLFTRDPSATFPPDICSRTTFVNFTITQSSLQSQSLNDVLKSERPDVDERRSNLIKMQGQFTVHLQGLEKRLLQALNDSRGNILDDDVVIETLETLKREAADISKKVAETGNVMAEVEVITAQYTPIARACSAIFSVLESLHHLNHFYQFSLQYFTDIFQFVLHNNPRLKAESDHKARTDIIIKDIFVTTFQRAALSLLQKDRVTLGLLLAQATPYTFDRDLLEMILDSRIAGTDVSSQPDSKKDAMKLSEKFPSLKGFADKIPVDDWQRFEKEELAEQYIPKTWTSKTNELDQLLQGLAMVKLFRLDRFVPAAEKFLVAVFGKEIFETSGDLEQVIDQVAVNTPISLCSSPGFDASYKVDLLVEKRKTSCNNIAMGSNEGPAAADKAIANAAANGSWVLIKNVHLAVSWLQGVEKKLSSLKPRPGFRLILSMEKSNKIPVNLLRASRILSYEQPAGIRANMRDSLSTLGSKDVEKPVEKARLILLLSFLHAVIQERLRYAPTLGWKGFWEFNDADYECACFVIEHWIDKISGNRTNIGITRIPWDLLRVLIRETYAGKIDDEEDYKTLSKMVDSVFVPGAFDDNHLLVKPDAESQLALSVPSGTTMNGFKKWVKELPEREPPTWLGLPANAEKLILVGQGRRTIEKVWTVRKVLEEGEKLMNE